MAITTQPGRYRSLNKLEGTSATTQVVGPFVPEPGVPVWLTLSGTWTGTVRVSRSVDNGATKHPLTAAGEPWAVFTTNCCEEVHDESESEAELYLDITRSSGTVEYRLAQ